MGYKTHPKLLRQLILSIESMAVWTDLSEDIVTEILLRLPVKSLVRFRCVCRSWLLLIQSRRFVDLHLRLAKGNERILIYQIIREKSKPVLSFHSNDELLSVVAPYLDDIPGYDYFFSFVGSCNGIVCLCANRIDGIFLFNPALRQSKRLPPRPFGCPPGLEDWAGPLGFGYDPITDDYKVVKFVDIWEEETENCSYPELVDNKVEIYNLSTNTWRQLDGFSKQVGNHRCFSIFFNGCFHWYDDSGPEIQIVSFNMATEVFLNIPLPESGYLDSGETTGNVTTTALVTLDECLAFILYTVHKRHTSLNTWEKVDDQFFDVWIMKEYGVKESWTKRYHVGPLSNIEFPLSSWKTDGLLLQTTDGQLVSCDLNTQQVQEYDIYEPRKLDAVSYKESLVSLDRDWCRI